ncbi:hypothetical protein ACFZBP_40775 [Streptomyces sp. NPDC008086]|uniref:hypothetical protein n=1 Tax=Streptomyces sp. NPDC008086 TaxID=3364807 RepID=UPI0036E7C302
MHHLLGWAATHVLLMRSIHRVTAPAQHSKDDDRTNYGSKADDANHQGDEAHCDDPFSFLASRSQQSGDDCQAAK